MDKIIFWANAIAQCLAALVILSSIIVRLTPSQKDDKSHSKIAMWIFKVLKWLPTLGINPNTRIMQDCYDKMLIENQEKAPAEKTLELKEDAVK